MVSLGTLGAGHIAYKELRTGADIDVIPNGWSLIGHPCTRADVHSHVNPTIPADVRMRTNHNRTDMRDAETTAENIERD